MADFFFAAAADPHAPPAPRRGGPRPLDLAAVPAAGPPPPPARARPEPSRLAAPRGKEPFAGRLEGRAPLRPGPGAPLPCPAGPGGAAERVDIRELLREEALRESVEVAALRGGKKGRRGDLDYSDQYLVLDSWRKLRDSDLARGEMRWNLMVQGEGGDEHLGVADQLSNVVEMQMGPFTLPVLPEVPYALGDLAGATGTTVEGTAVVATLVRNNTGGGEGSTPAPTLLAAQFPAVGPMVSPPYAPWVHNPYTQLPHFGRLTVQVREAGRQAVPGRRGRAHHFEFGVALGGGAGGSPLGLAALPACGWDTFLFSDSIRDMPGLGLVFRNPDAPIVFEPDVFYEAVAFQDPAADYNLRFDFAGHNLRQGDRIFVEGFDSRNPALNAYVNRAEGHLAGGVPNASPLLGTGDAIPSAGSFFLDPSLRIPVGVPFLTSRVVVPAGPGGSPPAVYDSPSPRIPVTVYVAKRRLRIPVRLGRVVERRTNFQSV